MKHLILVTMLFFVVGCAVGQIKGVDISLQPKYESAKSSGVFQCDGDRNIPFSKVNDDYCDCADGTDEPGTSACPNSHFYCVNAGYKGILITSSKVDDGVCDCCDGSDEQEGVCANTCIDIGAEWRKSQMDAAEAYISGFNMRSAMEKEAKEILETKQTELNTFKARNEVLQKEIDVLEEDKKKEEAIEAVERARLQAISDAEFAARAPVSEDVPAPDEDQTAKMTANVTNPEPPIDPDMDDMMEHHKPEPTPIQIVYTSDEGDKIRGQIDKLRGEQSEVNVRIREFEQLLGTDFGDEKEYFSGHGSCYEADTREYVYRLCPFDKVEQESKSNKQATSLGKWDAWRTVDGNAHGVQHYKDGEHCWKGPNRSTRVTMVCAPENVLKDVEEPEKCTYTMTFTTPAACDGTHAAALKRDFDSVM